MFQSVLYKFMLKSRRIGVFLVALIFCAGALQSQAQSLIHYYPMSGVAAGDAAGTWDLNPIGTVSSDQNRFMEADEAQVLTPAFTGGMSSTAFGPVTVDSAFTFAAWIKVTSAIPDQKMFGHFDPSAFSGPLFGIQAGQLDAELIGNGQTRLTTGSIPDGVWTHVAVTWKYGDAFTAYIDGVDVGSVSGVSATVPTGFSSTRNFLGSAPWDASAFQFDGSLDEVRFYDYALSMAEIEALACPAELLTAGMTSSVTSEAAVFSWASSGADVHQVEYGATGFSIGAGTRETSTSPSFMISGLMPLTTYEWYGRDTCVGGSTPWVGPFSFATIAAPCDTPSAPFTDVITDSSALLTWTVSPAAPMYDVEWGEAGFGPGFGTLETVSGALPLEDLEPSTDYEWYLRSICSSSASEWLGPISFTTDSIQGNTGIGDIMPAWHSIGVDAGSRLVELGWDGPGIATFRIFDPIGRMITGGAVQGAQRVVLPSAGWYVVEIQGRNSRAHRELIVL